MDLRYIKANLEKNIACLPGGRDLKQSPIILFPSHGEWKQFPYEEVVQVLGYLSQIPDDKSRSHGFTVIVDMRRAWIRYLKTIMRACQQVLFGFLRQVVIIKPEQFLEKQRIFIDLMLEAYQFKVDLVSMHKLSRYVQFTQLPPLFGGSFPYDHKKWIEMRERYEQFLFEGSVTLKNLKQNKIDKLSTTTASSPEPTSSHDETFSDDASIDSPRIVEIVHRGQTLLNDLRGVQNAELGEISLRQVNPDQGLAADRVETLLRQLKNAQDPNSHDDNKSQQSSEAIYEQFVIGVENMLDWLVAPGEKWLLTLHEIGESKDEARQLCKDHDQLNMKAQEILVQVSELNSLSGKLTEMTPSQANLIKQKRDYLDDVARNFVARVQHQSEVCQMSVYFHQLHIEFTKKMDDLLEKLCTDVDATNVESTQVALEKLESQIEAIDKAHQQLLTNGHNFTERLKVQEQNSLGHEVTRDYLAGVVHVKQLLADCLQRRKRCNDLVDVRRLKLQQLLQLYTCERDGEQAIKWIHELYEALLTEYKQSSSSQTELKQLQEDQSKLEHTARSTYDYGRQLTQVSLVLRRSLRMDVGPQLNLTRRLESAWALFCRALSEHNSQLTISQAFYSTVKEVNNRLEDLCLQVGSEKSTKKEEEGEQFKQYDSAKRKVDLEVRELRHMADALITRIEDESSYDTKSTLKKGKFDSATDIRSKINEIESKRQELENLWYEPIKEHRLSRLNLNGDIR